MNSFIIEKKSRKKGGKKRSRKDNTLILGRARHVVYQVWPHKEEKAIAQKNTIYFFFFFEKDELPDFHVSCFSCLVFSPPLQVLKWTFRTRGRKSDDITAEAITIYDEEEDDPKMMPESEGGGGGTLSTSNDSLLSILYSLLVFPFFSFFYE